VELYGIASRRSADVEGWWATRADAEQVLAQVLGEAPELSDVLYVDAVELDERSDN
jgi:hypothetical protein